MNSPNNHPVFLGSAIKGSRMRWLAHSLIFALLCWSCAAALPSPQTPALPMQAFIDQVLDPLAGQIADEWAEESKAEFPATHPTSMPRPSTGSMASGAGAMLGGFLGEVVAASNQEAIQKYHAAIDARRQPIKKELLTLFTRQARPVEDQYSVCVDGAERRYGVKDNGFIQLPDGPGPCEKTVISTKGSSENTDR